MVYGIVGIPVGMLVIANVGKFVAEGVREAIVISHGLMRRKRSHVAGKLLERSVFAIGLAEGAELPLGDPYKQEKLSLPALFILFVVYIALGTLILPCYENMSFFTASYFAFISITTGMLFS